MAEATLSPKTQVTVNVAAAASIILALVSCTYVVVREFVQLKAQLQQVQRDSYTISAASEVALRTAMENPGLRVPDPRNPEKLLVSPGPHTYSGITPKSER